MLVFFRGIIEFFFLGEGGWRGVWELYFSYFCFFGVLYRVWFMECLVNVEGMSGMNCFSWNFLELDS